MTAAVVKSGQRVRLVQMDGCMAHVRGRVDEGTVEALETKTVYGDSTERPYARIRFDDGRIEDRCAERHCWYPNETDGVMEYRY
jgi:hypothetical protein